MEKQRRKDEYQGNLLKSSENLLKLKKKNRIDANQDVET